MSCHRRQRPIPSPPGNNRKNDRPERTPKSPLQTVAGSPAPLPNIYARYPDVEPTSRPNSGLRVIFLHLLLPIALSKQLFILAHMKGTHDQIKDKVCSICHKKFSYDSDVQRHVKKVHQQGLRTAHKAKQKNREEKKKSRTPASFKWGSRPDLLSGTFEIFFSEARLPSPYRDTGLRYMYALLTCSSYKCVLSLKKNFCRIALMYLIMFSKSRVLEVAWICKSRYITV